MTWQQRRQRSAALVDHLRSARARLAAALQAMDYNLALTYQVNIDELQREIILLHAGGHDPFLWKEEWVSKG
jgi:hypothetical protein